MILEQFYLGCLSHASYLIGDERTRTAIIVDPQRDVDAYLEGARRADLQIRHVFLTHFHADFVAGHLELRARTGATIHVGARGRPDYEFIPVSEGETFDFGDVRLGILETPGHTPEGISILVYDLAKSDRIPRAVLTGDTLFVGDVGRPDLMASAGFRAEELAGWMYDSLHGKLLLLPDETLVYPAHGAGSMCGKRMGPETFSTLGEQRRSNYALQPMSREEFVRLLTTDLPEAPAYFSHDAAMNRRERPTLEESLVRSMRPLSVDDLLRGAGEGATLLDVREPIDFAGGHLIDAINIPLSGSFASWAGTLLDPERPIVLIADPGTEREAALRLGRIGYDHVDGFLDGGMQGTASRPDSVRRLERTTPTRLAEELSSAAPPVVLDVRTPTEWESVRIEGSINLPLDRLPSGLGEVPRGRRTVIHCATGHRSSIAASLLERTGLTDVVDLAGGMAAWMEAGQETATGAVA